ncbi:hypothetical protein ONS95_003514 [Cadophora gregata]|uniref:uncharacterized protein n=1 Tax=Cadophora gregata TaxID=51156 RepID=UPI0026DD1350|nr:uncharacterized protein ONS95_003514 [Cadophora gregata]KAK0106789.1 hypothetical protein ONS95_003514 [Cadophora gregata]
MVFHSACWARASALTAAGQVSRDAKAQLHHRKPRPLHYHIFSKTSGACENNAAHLHLKIYLRVWGEPILHGAESPRLNPQCIDPAAWSSTTCHAFTSPKLPPTTATRPIGISKHTSNPSLNLVSFLDNRNPRSSSIAITMLYGIIPRNVVSFNAETDIPALDGKIILVTGGNVGLGKQTILQLSKHNPKRIYLAARTESKAEAAIKEIQSLVPSAPITYIHCDLTSLTSVQQCAREFTSKEERLDLLFLNAGIMATPPGTTAEGYEIQFGTNHIGHALLTKLLLPTLVKTAAAPGSDVRVISLSSVGHLYAPWSGLSFPDLKTDMRGSTTWCRYAQSKLANILFARGLQKRVGEKGIKAVAVHPGVVDTELYRSTFSGYGPLGRLLDKGKRFVYTGVEKGALNQLWAGVGKDVEGGEYYTPVGVSGQGSKWSVDEGLADALWEWTEKELVGYKI